MKRKSIFSLITSDELFTGRCQGQFSFRWGQTKTKTRKATARQLLRAVVTVGANLDHHGGFVNVQTRENKILS
jgi:hypothetical protein